MKPKSSARCAKEAFLALYHAGEFSSGDKLPAETQMAQRLGVSRETWRKALDLLRSDGLVVSRHGSGTYLLEQPHRIANDLSQLQSMSDMIASAGIRERASEISCFPEALCPEACAFFQVPADRPFFCLQRIRHADVGIISASKCYLSPAYADLIDPDHPPHSLFAHLENSHGIYISRAFTELFIPPADDALSSRFDRTCGVIGFRQFHYDSRGNAALYSLDYLRADLFHFTILRTRP